MVWMLASTVGWAAGFDVPPVTRLQGTTVAVGMETTVANGPPIGGRVDLSAFGRGLTYGAILEAGLQPAPGAWFVDTLAADIYGGGQVDLGRIGDSTAVLTPYLGLTAHRWLPDRFTSWGPVAGGFLDLWGRSATRRPSFATLGVRLGGQVRFLPVVTRGGMVFLAQPSLSLSICGLNAHRARR